MHYAKRRSRKAFLRPLKNVNNIILIQESKKDGKMKAIINCARNEREMYEDTRWRALPTHVPSTVFNTRVENYKGEFEWEEVSTWDLFGGRRVLLFSLPGAFTPTCSTYQLPNFEKMAPELKSK